MGHEAAIRFWDRNKAGCAADALAAPAQAPAVHAAPSQAQEDWDAVSAAALALFAFGQEQAAQRGLLLVDTKYEFGKDEDGAWLPHCGQHCCAVYYI